MKEKKGIERERRTSSNNISLIIYNNIQKRKKGEEKGKEKNLY